MFKAKHLPSNILDLYQEYTTSVSTRSAAISLETCDFLWKLCNERNPKVIVDTGSGFSSFVLRLWSKDKGSLVYSFDDSKHWIEKSKAFSAKNGVSIDNFVVWKGEFHIKDADILLHDLGNMITRSNTLDTIYKMVKHTGVIILDDLHKANYRESANNFFAKRGYAIKNIDDTKDEFSRFVGVVDLSTKI